MYDSPKCPTLLVAYLWFVQHETTSSTATHIPGMPFYCTGFSYQRVCSSDLGAGRWVKLLYLYLIVSFWYASAANQASLVEPWFVFWRDAVNFLEFHFRNLGSPNWERNLAPFWNKKVSALSVNVHTSARQCSRVQFWREIVFFFLL